ncbi:hypothetical protein [Sulfolobus acidocaldarius]|uniref:Uncharacterized protein n=3 Tax=Sulfolobus acidocaldarius TaxID=2285 RepID=A0A0U3H2V5_9CREN|nr:hypothetical protein [Sulfolobus acidocaldarius]AGE70731.1 hypothetical protein SacN8_03795 [Sulfolobus acidocaldarius N8]AGE73003.1 hypothetical protein SacRon12I_03780 [Sulfolobus acidocaldarius Ron12/I]ALU28935.1 hypothetical protein ATY89_02490 [Sulfolobus acidocaldarius]ALU31661.1 hypothetical protein ATZ20_05525 [Sulfolobus acidocaldarius]WCM34704.1 hypothetical protein GO597_04840 [Sulfolobus acidocaldarius DSM 639]
MDEGELKKLILSILRKNVGEIDEKTFEIRFSQSFRDKVSTYGRFETSNGVYEFAVMVDKKGKVLRDHVNLIMPKNVKNEIEDKIRNRE